MHTIKFGQENTKFIIEMSPSIPISEMWALIHNLMKQLNLTQQQCLQIFNLDKIIQENEVAKNN